MSIARVIPELLESRSKMGTEAVSDKEHKESPREHADGQRELAEVKVVEALVRLVREERNRITDGDEGACNPKPTERPTQADQDKQRGDQDHGQRSRKLRAAGRAERLLAGRVDRQVLHRHRAIRVRGDVREEVLVEVVTHH
jgi:hypothetical protein